MPKVALEAVPSVFSVGYPAPFKDQCRGRARQRLGDAGGLNDFGINLTILPPGKWSSQRHWHSHEDEFVFVVDGHLVLVEDEGETLLVAGDCATFRKGSGNGHHLVNRSNHPAKYLEIGSRFEEDRVIYSDIDMKTSEYDGSYVHKDGSRYD